MLAEAFEGLTGAKAAELRHADWRREPPCNGQLRTWAAFRDEQQGTDGDWAAFADWLIERASPDDRHRIIARYDWELGTEIALWIIRQPDTQLATVFTAVWRALPEQLVHVLGSGSDPRPEDAERIALLREIRSRVSQRFYRPPFLLRCIGFNGHDPLFWDTRAVHLHNAQAELIPDAAFRQIPGRALCPNAALTGCPVDL